MYKAIITDLDRTLLHTDKTISPYTLEVLKRCKAAGMFVMVATARPLRAIEHYWELIKPDAVTVMNGAQVICGERVERFGMSRESAEKVLEQLCSSWSSPARDVFQKTQLSAPSVEKIIPISLEMGNEVYSNVAIPDFESIIYKDFPKLPEGEAAYKIIVTLEEESTIKLIKEILPENLYYTIANGHLIQIMSKSATKWKGIKTMLEFAGCTPEEAIYFGDDFDDIEPIKMCGAGVGVSNGIEEVKAVADYIAESNDEDGVAGFLEEFLNVEPER